MSGTTTSVTALRAEDFVQSIGVNTHISWDTAGWTNATNIENAVAYLGIDHIRDSVPLSWDLSTYTALAKAGVKFDLLASSGTFNIASDLAAADTLAKAVSGSVATIEGPNEINLQSSVYNGTDSTSNLGIGDQIQSALYSAVKADGNLSGTKVVNLSLGGATSAQYNSLGNMSASANYSNAHVYFPNGMQPASEISQIVSMAKTEVPNSPTMITELGYYTATGSTDWGGVNQDVQAKGTLNALMDAFKSGVVTTFLYELMDNINNPASDDREDSFGLFNADGTPKEAATAIHNLTSILGDTGSTATSFSAGSLSYGLSGMPSSGNSMLLEKSSGVFDVVLWAEPNIWNESSQSEVSAASSTVTMSLGGTYASVSVYDPLKGTTPIATYSNVSSVQVAVSDHPVIIEVSGSAGGSASTGTTTTSGGTGTTTSASSGSSSTSGATGSTTTSGATGSTTTSGATGGTTTSGATGGTTTSGSMTSSSSSSSSSSSASSTAAKSYALGSSGGNVTSTGADTITAGSGNATVSASGAAKITGGTGAMSLALTGSGASVTDGSGTTSIADAKGGNTITGGTGNTTISVAAGNDSITTNGWTNTVNLGSGNSTLTVAGNADVTTAGGQSTINVTGSWLDLTTGSGATKVTFSSGSGVVYANGTTTIDASKAITQVTLQANAGSNSTITGGTQALYISGDGNVSVNGGTAGNSTIYGGAGNTVVTDKAGTANSITLGSGNATITAGGADTINAAGGHTTVIGGTSALHVNGGSGALKLVAGSGNETLTAGSGPTEVDFGKGHTTVIGGSGSESYVFTNGSGGGTDVIKNFNVGTDHLHLSGYNQSAASVIAGGHDTRAGFTMSLSDGTTIVMSGLHSLTASAFN